MQAHEERKNFAEKYYPQVWRFLSKTRRACPCAVGDVLTLPVGDVLTLQSKNMFQKFIGTAILSVKLAVSVPPSL